MARWLTTNSNEHWIIPEEHRALRRARGKLDSLSRYQAVTSCARARGKTCVVIRIDYSKAYDHILHAWVKNTSQAIGCFLWFRHMLDSMIESWYTRFKCWTGKSVEKSKLTKFESTLLQEDFLRWLGLSWLLHRSRLPCLCSLGVSVRTDWGDPSILNGRYESLQQDKGCLDSCAPSALKSIDRSRHGIRVREVHYSGIERRKGCGGAKHPRPYGRRWSGLTLKVSSWSGFNLFEPQLCLSGPR